MSESTTRHRILELLAGHNWVSGQELANRLGISRTAVWKHIHHLQSQSIEIEQARGRGYRLAKGLDLLQFSVLRKVLDAHAPTGTSLVYELVCDSTNTIAREMLANTGLPMVCVTAEQQKAGRGRMGRKWISPLGAHLYFSVGFRWKTGYETLSALSLAVGTAIAEALQTLTDEPLALKWPNDIHAQGAKLAGILVELEGEQGGEVRIVLGVGINIYQHAWMDSIDQPWMTLEQIAKAPISRTQVLANVLVKVLAALKVYEMHGWKAFMPRWQDMDRYSGRAVEIRDTDGHIIEKGIYEGVDETGCLVLRTDNGLKPIHSGEVSLRANP